MKKLITASLLALVLLTSTTQAANEGIKVHGHWIFNIYNPDGSFDRKVEFENSLTTTGASALLKILGADKRQVNWFVKLVGDSATGDNPCKDSSSSIVPCQLAEGPLDPNFPDIFVLTQSLDNNTNPTKLILSGSMTTATGLTNPNIGQVTTSIGYCDTDTLIMPCAQTFSSSEFTTKTLTPVPLNAGQVVAVTVEISFN